MSAEMITDFAREAVFTTILSALPLLLTALTVGLLVSVFQTITSIQEQTLAFVPKILAVFLGLLIFGPHIGRQILEFFTNTMLSINQFIR
ncbi:flagellar biosynthesis protein FliQ [Vallitaleaceae bacterium 9-2]